MIMCNCDQSLVCVDRRDCCMWKSLNQDGVLGLRFDRRTGGFEERSSSSWIVLSDGFVAGIVGIGAATGSATGEESCVASGMLKISLFVLLSADMVWVGVAVTSCGIGVRAVGVRG